MYRHVLTLSVLLLSSLIFVPRSAFAQAGSLDSSFGAGGTVTTNLGASNSVIAISDVALQSDGNIVVVALAASGTVVLRYLPDGSLDTSFGNSGISLIPLSNAPGPAYSVALQSDGKIVIGGGGSGFALQRLTANGTLDTTFGTSGQVITAFANGFQAVRAVLIQPDGKILAAGWTEIVQYKGGGTFTALARYNRDGILDTSFGKGGTVVTSDSHVGTTVAGLDAAGNIFVLDQGAIAEFDPSGVLSASVKPATIIASSGHGDVNAFYPDGRYLASNVVTVMKHDEDERVVRYTPTGAVDTSFSNSPFDFGSGGPSRIDSGGVSIQPDGSIIVAGSHQVWGTWASEFALARLTPNGSLDTTFGNGGTVTTAFANPARGAATLIQPNGDIVEIGTATDSSTQVGSLVLARYRGK